MTASTGADPSPLRAVTGGAATAKRMLDAIEVVLDPLLVLLLAGIVLDVAAGVISRYVFNASFRWTEEVGFILFAWLIFAGITRAHRRRQHIAVDIIAVFAPASWRPVMDFLANFVVAYTTCVMIFSAWDAAILIGGVLPALGWPTEIRYLPLCGTGALGLVCLVLRDLEEGRSPWPMVAAIALGVVVFVLTGVLDAIRLPALAPTQVMLIAFVGGLAVGAPIGFVLLFAAYLATWGADLLPAAAVAQNMINGASKFILLAIPLFLLAGYLMNAGGLTTRLYNLAFALVGHWRGGFAQVNAPGVIFVFQGLRVIPVSGPSVTPFQPNSGVVVLPSSTAPCSRSRATTGASSFHGPFGSMVFEPRKVGQPRVSRRSLMETGTPSSRPRGAPFAQRFSDCFAVFKEESKSR